MRRLLFTLCAPLFVLGGCQLGPQQEVAVAEPQGIEGRWSSVGGPVAYTATFSNGNFSSRESGTNGLLGSGSYTNLGPGQINIVYTSTTRNEQVAVNCNQTAPSRLSCATSSGSRFELTRI